MRTQWVIRKSLFVQLLSSFLVLVFLGVSFSVIKNFETFDSLKGYFALAISCLMIFSLVIAFFYMPRFLYLTDSDLVLQRVGSTKEFPFEKIKSISSYKLSVLNLGLRLFGSGGLFGFFGIFRNKEVGKYYLYAGHLSDSLLLEMIDGQKYIIGAEEIETLIQEIKKSMKKCEKKK